jgi:D-arabinose 1-dehydrogenase-like Zn-dependent alcohol dehydrogenase
MKAAVMEQFGQPLKVQEWSDPERGPRDVVIEVGACGICRFS